MVNSASFKLHWIEATPWLRHVAEPHLPCSPSSSFARTIVPEACICPITYGYEHEVNDMCDCFSLLGKHDAIAFYSSTANANIKILSYSDLGTKNIRSLVRAYHHRPSYLSRLAKGGTQPHGNSVGTSKLQFPSFHCKIEAEPALEDHQVLKAFEYAQFLPFLSGSSLPDYLQSHVFSLEIAAKIAVDIIDAISSLAEMGYTLPFITDGQFWVQEGDDGTPQVQLLIPVSWQYCSNHFLAADLTV